MPAISLYLSNSQLAAVRSCAQRRRVPVAKVVQEAVEQYVGHEDQDAARKAVLQILVKKRPLGNVEEWETLHSERTETDVDRA